VLERDKHFHHLATSSLDLQGVGRELLVSLCVSTGVGSHSHVKRRVGAVMLEAHGLVDIAD
jgi:hypothetical protein